MPEETRSEATVQKDVVGGAVIAAELLVVVQANQMIDVGRNDETELFVAKARRNLDKSSDVEVIEWLFDQDTGRVF